MPYVRAKPLATKQALYRSKDPSEMYFVINTHLHPTTDLPLDSSTFSQVEFSSPRKSLVSTLVSVVPHVIVWNTNSIQLRNKGVI